MLETMLVPDLRSDAGVRAALALHNSRPSLDWVDRPNDAALPAVTLQRAGLDRVRSQDGPAGLTGTRVQVDGWGLTPATARAAFDAVRKALERGSKDRWRAFWLTDGDTRPEDVPGVGRVFRASGDFMVWYQEN